MKRKRKRLIIGIDLDNTLCTDRYESGGIKKCSLKRGAKRKIWEMRRAGHKVMFFTHRGGAVSMSTRQWIYDQGIVHDGIIFEKPFFDIYIGDEARQFITWAKIKVEDL